MSNRIVLPFINILEVIIFNCLGLHKDNPEENMYLPEDRSVFSHNTKGKMT